MLSEFLLSNLKIVLVVLILLTRVVDIACTYLVSPGLLLETNPVVRRAKWPAGLLTVVLAFAPFFSVPLGVVILTMSFISSSLNIRKIWMLRAIGEEKYLETIVRCVQANGIFRISIFEFFSALFWVLLSAFLLVLNRENNPYVFWFGISPGLYGVLSFVYYMSYLFGIQKKFLSSSPEAEEVSQVS